MAVTENKMIRDFVDAIKSGTKDKTKAYESPATVTRVEDGIAWVHVPGGVEETPVQLTMAASEGDEVRVRVANGRATIVGNVTSPPTDDATAMKALSNANIANQAARSAAAAASSAEASAITAKEYAEVAKDTTDEINAYAETVGKTVTQVLEDGETAGAAAEQAKQSADTAFKQLGFVENIVGVLELVSKNGVYEPTQDPEVLPDKWYFTRSGTDPDYVYAVVNNPTGDPSAKGWYELTSINEAIQNYVSSHLVLMPDGLWLQASENESKIHISTAQGSEGVIIYGSGNKALASYGSKAIIGDIDNFHIEIDGQKIGFYTDRITEVAYMNGSSLYVENNLSFGHFIFTERANGHFTLKLID